MIPAIKKNRMVSAIVLYLCIYALIVYFKPAWLFQRDGSLRTFGIGYRNKTIFPIWLMAIFLGILCYVGVYALNLV